MKKLKLCLLLLIVFAFMSLPRYSYASGPIEFKMAALVPKGTQWQLVAEKIAKEIEKNTNGKVKFTWYFGGVMGDEKDAITKIRFSQLQGGAFSIMGLGVITDEIKVLEMPYLFKNYAEKDYVLKKMDKTFNAIFLKKGFVNLGWTEVGFISLFSDQDIKTWDQFCKTKMWVWGGDNAVHGILSGYGFKSLIPLDLANVLPSLQTGMLESFFGTCYTVVALQWFTHAKSMTHDNFVYSPAAILVAKKAYDKIPKKMLSTFHAAWKKHLPKLNRKIQQNEKEAFEGMKKNGTKVMQFNAKDSAFLQNNAKVVWDKYAGNLFPKALLNKVIKYREQYRKMNK